jgi:hypothetical protein
MTFAIASRVSSVELPSTQITSSAEPNCGKRRTSSGTCPASLRHGITTVTVSSPAETGSGRATIQCMRPRFLNGQMFATKPLRNIVRNGTCFGSSTRDVRVSTSKPARPRRLTTSSTETQLRIGLRGFRRSSSAAPMIGRQARLYVLITTRVRGCECRATESKSAWRSWTNGSRSERTIVSNVSPRSSASPVACSIRSSGCRSRASSTIPRLTSTPTPTDGSRAASRSPEPQPISSTRWPGGTWNCAIRSRRSW